MLFSYDVASRRPGYSFELIQTIQHADDFRVILQVLRRNGRDAVTYLTMSMGRHMLTMVNCLLQIIIDEGFVCHAQSRFHSVGGQAIRQASADQPFRGESSRINQRYAVRRAATRSPLSFICPAIADAI